MNQKDMQKVLEKIELACRRAMNHDPNPIRALEVLALYLAKMSQELTDDN